MVHSSGQRQTGRGQCCTADTPLRSFSNVSRSRPTTDQPRCFVDTWLMLILRKGSAQCWPRRTSPHPSVRLGPRGYFDGLTGPVAEGGTGLSKQDLNPPQGAYARGGP